MSPVARPVDHGFSKTKYQFKGYMGEEQYVEVPPNPISKEPKFKNWIEREIFIVKKTLN